MYMACNVEKMTNSLEDFHCAYAMKQEEKKTVFPHSHGGKNSQTGMKCFSFPIMHNSFRVPLFSEYFTYVGAAVDRQRDC